MTSVLPTLSLLEDLANSPSVTNFANNFAIPIWRNVQGIVRGNENLSYWARFLQGKIGRNSNPLHPAFVHAPVVLLPLSFLCDWLTLVPGLSWILGIHHSQFHVFSYYLNLIALLAAIPATLTGLAEFLEVEAKQPSWNKVFIHMMMNIFALLVSALNWSNRSSYDNFSPSWLLMFLNLTTLAGVFMSGHLGGNLVFEHTMGVQRQGDSKAKKDKKVDKPTTHKHDANAMDAST